MTKWVISGNVKHQNGENFKFKDYTMKEFEKKIIQHIVRIGGNAQMLVEFEYYS